MVCDRNFLIKQRLWNVTSALGLYGLTENLKDKMETLIDDNLVRRTEVSGPTFKSLGFYLFASASTMSTLTRICTQTTG